MPGFFCSEPVQDASDYESGPHWTGQSLEGQRTQPGRLGFCGWVVGLRIQAVSRDAVQSGVDDAESVEPARMLIARLRRICLLEVLCPTLGTRDAVLWMVHGRRDPGLHLHLQPAGSLERVLYRMQEG